METETIALIVVIAIPSIVVIGGATLIAIDDEIRESFILFVSFLLLGLLGIGAFYALIWALLVLND